MKYLYAGCSKTGTKSIATVFRILNFEVCDVEETIYFHHTHWLKMMDPKTSFEQKKALIYEMYKDFDMVTDYPANYFWELILEVFPDCKIIFFERETEAWYKSLLKTLNDYHQAIYVYPEFIANPLNRLLVPTHYKSDLMLRTINQLICGQVTHGKRLKNGKFQLQEWNEFEIKKLYRRHNANVKANAPKDKILILQNNTWNWETICKFVEKPIPTNPETGKILPFPHENRGGSGQTKIVEQLLTGSNQQSKVNLVTVFGNEFKTRSRILMGVLALAVGSGLFTNVITREKL